MLKAYQYVANASHSLHCIGQKAHQISVNYFRITVCSNLARDVKRSCCNPFGWFPTFLHTDISQMKCDFSFIKIKFKTVYLQ